MPWWAPIRGAGKGRLMVSISGEAGGATVQLRGEGAGRPAPVFQQNSAPFRAAEMRILGLEPAGNRDRSATRRLQKAPFRTQP